MPYIALFIMIVNFSDTSFVFTISDVTIML